MKPSFHRQRTFAIDRDEVDFRVLEYRCLDSSVLTSLGQHCKQTHWKVQVGPKVVEIQLRVDRSVVGTCEVGALCDGEQVYPRGGDMAVASTSSKSSSGKMAMKGLKETFTWRCPFRGTIEGIGKPRYFQIRPKHLTGDTWFPATVKEQLDNGAFRVTAYLPDASGGEKEVFYPLADSSQLRFAAKKRPVGIPERALVLTIPAQDPLHATLAVDDGELITHFFARPTPPLMSASRQTGAPQRPPKTRIVLQVSKDRSMVTSAEGFAAFRHFLAGDVRASRQESTKLRHLWVLQAGPFAEHRVEVAKHPKSAKVYVLTVDGEVLVESSAEDIDSREDVWECQFRLMGEKTLEWELFESDVDGNMLDAKASIVQRTKYSHELLVTFSTVEPNLAKAQLQVDGVDFHALSMHRPPGREEPLRLSPEGLQGTYNLATPYKVNESAPSAAVALQEALRALFCSPGEYFLRCCGRQAAMVDEGNMPFRPERPAAVTWAEQDGLDGTAL